MEELCVHLIVPFIEVSESRGDPTYDGRQLKIRAPAATFYGILDADCAQTEIAHSAREAVLGRL